MFDNDLYIAELQQASDWLAHIGVAWDANPPGRGSGRYAHGSGEHAFQHESWYGWKQTRDQLAAELKAQGLSGTALDRALAEKMNMSSSEYRRMVTITNEQRQAAYVTYAAKAMEGGMSRNAVAKELGISESTLRSMMSKYDSYGSQKVSKTADVLEECLKTTKYLDIGSGTAEFMTDEKGYKISNETISAATELLKQKGYVQLEVSAEQFGTQNGQRTTMKLLVPNPDGLSEKELKNQIYQNMDEIHPVSYHFEEINGEVKAYNWEYPNSINSDRVNVRYAEDGGTDRDGMIEIRRGCKDLDLGDNVNYAQVRIGVDGTHYLKGMAVYSDGKDWPEGVDIMFNTNKTKDKPMMGEDNNHSVLKLMDLKDPNNPFGSALRQKDSQYHYTDDEGNEVLSPINKCKQEGDWDKQRLSLPSQFLAKQPVPLAQEQLKTNYDNLVAEYDSIMQLTNPVVRKSQLLEFSEKCDSESVDLRGARMPGQKTKVILSDTSLKENECYLPDFEDGARIVAIRYPHANVAEIPVLTNNTKNKAAKELIGDGVDAIVINPKAAAQLSGADFDGDTVTVFRDEERKVVTHKPIQDLVDFEPKRDYAAYDGMTRVGLHKDEKKDNVPRDGFDTQKQMGTISNLIMDMHVAGCTVDNPDMINATKYSMVVIDAEKHNLNWKQAKADLDINRISKEWRQGEGGAATLLTRAKNPEPVTQKQIWKAASNSINPETGEKIYKDADGSHYIDKNGVAKTKKTQSVKGKEWDIEDLYSSNGPTRMEKVYGEYMQKCRDLANKARLDWLDTPKQEYNSSAAKTYAAEVESLEQKLRTAKANAPRERQAQAICNADYKAILAENPHIKEDSDAKKKLRNTLLTNARLTTGAHKTRINPTDKEWEAIQAGAIHDNMLQQIISNSDSDRIKELAMPRTSRTISSAQQTRIKNLRNNGYSIADIADFMGISTSSVSNVLNPSSSAA